MKNKLFLAFAAILFAAITLFNLNLTQQEAASDITLAGVEMEAGAFMEGGGHGSYGCTAYSNCYTPSGRIDGHVSCSGSTCSRGTGWVTCNGVTTNC